MIRLPVLTCLFIALLGLAACTPPSMKPDTQPVPVTFLDGQFSVMMPPGWSVMTDLNDDADLQIGNDRKGGYCIVLSENMLDFDDLSLQTHSDITRSSLRENLENYSESEPEYLQLGPHRAVRYKILGSIDGVKIIYWHVTIETRKYFHQTLLWSLPSEFPKVKSDFDAILESFTAVRE